MTDPTLESQLQSLGEAIHTDKDLVDRVGQQIDAIAPAAHGRPRTLAVAASIAILILALVVTIAPAREAVAGWLGIGRTSITIAQELPDAPATTTPTRPATTHNAIRAAALEELGIEVLLPVASAVGSVDGWEIADFGVESELIVVWGDISFTARRSDGDFGLRKIVISEEVVSATLTTDGDAALWVSGPHIRVNEEGFATVEDALLWVRDAVEYRLVGIDNLEKALAIAATLE